MVFPISSVVRFSLAERKTNNKEKAKYRCEHHRTMNNSFVHGSVVFIL